MTRILDVVINPGLKTYHLTKGMSKFGRKVVLRRENGIPGLLNFHQHVFIIQTSHNEIRSEFQPESLAIYYLRRQWIDDD